MRPHSEEESWRAAIPLTRVISRRSKASACRLRHACTTQVSRTTCNGTGANRCAVRSERSGASPVRVRRRQSPLRPVCSPRIDRGSGLTARALAAGLYQLEAVFELFESSSDRPRQVLTGKEIGVLMVAG